jgi:S1-C subfamily serine protease
MRKTIATFLLALLLVTPAKASDWTDIVNRVLKSVVYLEASDGTCTGFVIDAQRKYVLTAAHCVAEDLWLDRVSGKLVSKDLKKDLAVYKVDELDPARPALLLADKDPEIGQEVMSVGFGMCLERPFFRKAMVSDTAVQIPEAGIGGPYIGLDAAFVGGQSGGPVVNHNGEVVMIVQRASGTVGIGVAASVIREKMGRFFAAKGR